jgi:hypothetical protein
MAWIIIRPEENLIIDSEKIKSITWESEESTRSIKFYANLEDIKQIGLLICSYSIPLEESELVLKEKEKELRGRKLADPVSYPELLYREVIETIAKEKLKKILSCIYNTECDQIIDLSDYLKGVTLSQ